MLSCVYCEEEFFEEGKGSFEHVILSSLGGRKGSNNICCESCNNRLGRDVDKSTSDQLLFISNMLGVKTGRNKSIKAISNVGEMNGRSFDLKSGMIPFFSKMKFEQIKFDNKVKAKIGARNKKELFVALNKFYSKYNKKIDDMNNEQVRISADYNIPEVTGTVSLGGELFFRSIAKMMLTYLATICSPSIFRSGVVDSVIKFVNGNDGVKVHVYHDYMSKYPKNKLSGPFSHMIFIYSFRESNRLYCGFRLFGHFQFGLILSDEWNGGDIHHCYEIDPICGKALNYELNIDEDDIKYCSSHEFEYIKNGLNHAFNRFFYKFDLFKKRQVINNIIDEQTDYILSKHNVNNVSKLTEEQAKELCSNVGKHIAALENKTSVVQNMTLEEFGRLRYF